MSKKQTVQISENQEKRLTEGQKKQIKKELQRQTDKKINITIIAVFTLLFVFLVSMIGLNIYNNGKMGDYDSNYTATYSNFMKKDDNVYYIYMYQAECSNCLNTKPEIVAYQRSDMMTKNARLYTYCVDEDVSRGRFIKYDDESKTYVDELIGATSNDEVFVSSVPILILVRKSATTGQNEVASYVKGTTAIKAQLKIIVNYEFVV